LCLSIFIWSGVFNHHNFEYYSLSKLQPHILSLNLSFLLAASLSTTNLLWHSFWVSEFLISWKGHCLMMAFPSYVWDCILNTWKKKLPLECANVFVNIFDLGVVLLLEELKKKKALNKWLHFSRTQTSTHIHSHMHTQTKLLLETQPQAVGNMLEPQRSLNVVYWIKIKHKLGCWQSCALAKKKKMPRKWTDSCIYLKRSLYHQRFISYVSC
jgi:hypothetical protein